MTTTIRVIGTTGSRTFETVNIQSADQLEPITKHQHKVVTQLTAAQYALGPTGNCKTVQTSNAVPVGGTATVNNGLRNIIIVGYAGPS